MPTPKGDSGRASVVACSALAACATLSGCTATVAARATPERGIVAAATDLPDHFLVPATGLGQAEEPRTGEGCRNPLIDPRNGTSLKLVRSLNGVGDYQVLDTEFALLARYGVDPRHYLRVDCSTGKALGVVEP